MDALNFHISINALRHSSAGWGDLAYAKSLAEALITKGHAATLFFREEAPKLGGARDVVIRIIGPHLDEPVEGVVNLLWMISPPNLAPPRSLARYQGLFIASEPQCAAYKAQLDALRLSPPLPDLGPAPPPPVPQMLAQASDLHLFTPERASPDFGPLDLVFVGNHAPRAPRSHVLKAIALGFEPALWGQGWEGAVPQHLIRGKRVSAEELAAIYASAKVVLNSHMPMMARQGFMSNRSFDALACGAAVVSDYVAGFQTELPGLTIVAPDDDLVSVLTTALAAPPPALDQRRARHEAIRAGYSFEARAEAFISTAISALEKAEAAPFAYRPCGALMGKALAARQDAAPNFAGAALPGTDTDTDTDTDTVCPASTDSPAPAPSKPKLALRLALAPERSLPGDVEPAQLCALSHSYAVDLTVELVDPEVSQSQDARAELLRGARAVARVCRVLEASSQLANLTLLSAPEAATEQAHLIHSGQVDLRAALRLLQNYCALRPRSDQPNDEIPSHGPEVVPRSPTPALTAEPASQGPAETANKGQIAPPAAKSVEELAARARRLLEAAQTEFPSPEDRFALRRLLRVQRAAPLYEHSPADFDRDRQKRHVLLWPRQQALPPRRRIGVFLHLYYLDQAKKIRATLAHLEQPFQLYISTDSAAKAEHLATLFPGAELRVLANRGRDIWPKLYGFADRYAGHDLVLHLHGKRSDHSAGLAGWLDHILSCLLPEPPLLRRLISFFDSAPSLGLVAPATFRPTLASGHWGDNFELARELAARMHLAQPLPGNDQLVFPAGSMFWARPVALQPLLGLRLAASAFPPETGQIDGTPAHAIERLFGPVCRAQGFEMISVAPPSVRDWPGHAVKLRRNAELKALLSGGSFYETGSRRASIKGDPNSDF